MKLLIANSIRGFSGALLLSMAVSFVAPVVVDKAAETAGFSAHLVADANAQASKKKRRLPGISESFFKKLGKVGVLASPPEDSKKDPDFAAALKELKKVDKSCKKEGKCNEYEKAQVYNYYGWIYYSLEDTSSAIKYYDLVIKQSPNIPWGLELSTMYTLAQLEFSVDRYADAQKRLKKWMSLVENVNADAYYLLASICYQKDDKTCAQRSISKAVSMVEAQGKVAKEPWYGLQRALYFEQENYKAAKPILVKLVRHYPKAIYYQQLASVYGIMEQEMKQLGLLDATYIMGAIEKEQQLLNLSYLMIQNDYPYRAAKILDKAIKDKKVNRSERNLETLAKAWGQSQEMKKAIPVMAEAAKLSKNGNLYGVLMGMYLNIDNNKSAIKAGRDAIKKGDLKHPGEINLNIGIAYFELKNFDESIKYLERATEYKKAARFANSWLQHVKREKARAEALAAS